MLYAMTYVDNKKMIIIEDSPDLSFLILKIDESWGQTEKFLNNLISDLSMINKVQISMVGYRIDDRVDQCKFVYFG